MASLIVNDVAPSIQYTATSGQTVFVYPFAIFVDGDLVVYQTPVGTVPDDTDDLLTLTTEYTVSDAGETAGGNMTLVTGATTGDIITIKRNVPVARTSDYQNNGDFLAETLNDDFDKIVMMVQQNEDLLQNRILAFQDTAVLGSFDPKTLPSPTALYYLRVNDTATAWELVSISSFTNDSVATTAFTESLLDDADADAFWATLMATITKATARSSLDVPSNAEAVLDTLLSAKGDIIQASAADTPARLAIGNSGQLPAVNEAGDLLAYWAPKDYIAGLVLSNDTDADHDINIAAGEAADSTAAYILKLTSEITKQIDAIFAAGDDAGGLFDGTVANDTWYHVHLIRKDSDGSIDAGFDTSVTAANIPAGYTAYQCIGAVLTDGSANILAFSMNVVGGKRQVIWDTPVQAADGAPSTTRTLVTCQVPTGKAVEAVLDAFLHTEASAPDSGTYLRVYSSNLSDVTPSDANATCRGRQSAREQDVSRIDVITDTSGRVYIDSSVAASNTSVGINCIGWNE